MREPRVSDKTLNALCSYGDRLQYDRVALDLRDARAEIATLWAIIDKAETKLLETALRADRAEAERDEARRKLECIETYGEAELLNIQDNEIDELKARADRAEAALAQAGVVTAEMVEAALEVLVDFEWTGFMEVDVRAALEAALNARKEG